MLRRYDDNVQTTQGVALAGAKVYFLTQPANTTTLTPLATIYSDSLGTPASNPLTTDGFGQYYVYLDDSQLYTKVVTHQLVSQRVYTDQGILANNASITLQSLLGTINGINTVFSLPSTVTAGTPQIFLNGILQRPTTDYVWTGLTITFTVAPQGASSTYSGDTLYAVYTH